MKRVVAGANKQGRSAVIDVDELTDRFEIPIPLWHAPSIDALSVSSLPEPLDIGTPPGALTWMVFRTPPGYEITSHHTDTIDLHVIVAGSIDLVLETESVTLETGDSAMLHGIVHGWRTGPDGCTSYLINLGATARSDQAGWSATFAC